MRLSSHYRRGWLRELIALQSGMQYILLPEKGVPRLNPGKEYCETEHWVPTQPLPTEHGRTPSIRHTRSLREGYAPESSTADLPVSMGGETKKECLDLMVSPYED